MYVLSNLAISVDGKIAYASRSDEPLGTALDRVKMRALRDTAGAVVFGAGTLRSYKRPHAAADPAKVITNVVLSSRLEGVSPAWPFFKSERIRRLLIVSPKAPKATRRKFEASCDIEVLEGARSRSKSLLKLLDRLGFERVIVEGGGDVMWDFVRENLIDEYYVTVAPKLVGGRDAPTLVDGKGFASGKALNLRLLACEEIQGELFLRYSRK